MRKATLLVILLTCGSSSRAMDKDDFADYIQALKAHDYAGFSKYYSDDLRYHTRSGEVLDRNGAIASERALADVATWTMDVRRVVADEGGIAMEAVMHVQCVKDTPPDWPNRPCHKGDQVEAHFIALYTLTNGKISELRFFHAPAEGQQ